MKYPLEKYQFYFVRNSDGKLCKVIAVSTYAGKTVRGVAKCHPSDLDNFNEEYGKKLAAARCAVKVAEKRHDRAIKKYNEAHHILDNAAKLMLDMKVYVDDSMSSLDDAYRDLVELKTNIEL